VAPPAEQHRHSYQVSTKKADTPYIGHDEWQMATPMGLRRGDSLNLPDAPGDYVRG
jgi:hypothetical protein